MADKYFGFSSVLGAHTLVEATVVSTGVSEAGKILALDSAGKIDLSALPTGVGPDTKVAPASENLVAGNFVNFWNDSGTIKVRKADGGSNKYLADGFVLANVTAPNNATVYVLGINNAVTGKTLGAMQFLSGTPGDSTETVPTSNVCQRLGKALSATEIDFKPELVGYLS